MEEKIAKIKEYLGAIAPEFAKLPAATVFIELAIGRCSEVYFGDLWAQACAYLAAHFWTLSNRGGGATGTITNMKEGDLSVSYAAPNSKLSSLAQTSFGLEYEMLLKQCGKGTSITGQRFVKGLL